MRKAAVATLLLLTFTANIAIGQNISYGIILPKPQAADSGQILRVLSPRGIIWYTAAQRDTLRAAHIHYKALRNEYPKLRDDYKALKTDCAQLAEELRVERRENKWENRIFLAAGIVLGYMLLQAKD